MEKISLANLRWLYHASAGVRAKALFNVLLGTLSIAIDFAFIWASKECIDVATGKSGIPLGWAVASIIACVAAGLTIGFSRSWIGAILGTKSQNLMRLKTFSRLMHNVWTGRDSMHSGDSMNRLLKDSSTITSVITDTAPAIVCTLIRLVCAFLFLYSMQPLLSVVMLCIAPLFLLASRFYVRKMKLLSKDLRDTESRMHVMMQENLQNKMVIKTLEQSGNMVHSLSDLQDTYLGKVRNKTRFSSFTALVTNIGFSGGYLVTFVWGVYGLSAGTITYGMMMAFVQLVGQIQGPFRSITTLLPQIINAMVSVDRIRELEQTPVEDDTAAIRMGSSVGVRFDGVSYHYPADTSMVLNRFTHDFRPGTFTAVVGETGAGKTTMLRIILSLVHPTSGGVTLYSDTCTEETSPRTRCNLVYVPQGNTLLSGTVRDNLLLGNPDASDDDMASTLRMACADFVLRSPEGLDMTIGEDGAGVSEGQAQRICIARSLMRDGGVLLLDEVTSALDQDTERQIIHNIAHRASAKGQTVIFITHRTRVLDYCDNVVRMG